MTSEVSQAALGDLDLAKGFEAFTAAARRLEASHAALQRRAAAIDLQLERTNAELERSLREREAILSALPAGVLAIEAGEHVWSNPAGKRLLQRAAAAGWSLAAAEAGLHECGDLNVVVQRVALEGDDGRELVVVEDRSQVAELTREVDRLDRMAGLSELALGIAHEIKNPLNGVMGFAELLARSNDPEAQRRHVGKIHKGLTTVDAIVKDMLAFAVQPGRAEARAPLRDVVREAARAAEVAVDGDDAGVVLRGDLDLLVPGRALVRVLANLFRNSAEAVVGAPRIEVECEHDNGTCTIEVVDRGPGVPHEILEQVMHSAVTSKNGGHGLGLALAARVMEFLGGALSLVDSSSAGTRFRVTVACQAPQEPRH